MTQTSTPPGSQQVVLPGSLTPPPPPPPPPNGATAAGTTRALLPAPGPLDELPIAHLRHPTEPSRFALAITALAVAVGVALFVLVSLGQATVLLVLALGIAVAVLLIWTSVQLWRVRLIGDAVLVTAQTLPEVQEVMDAVRARLDYTGRVHLFVVDKISRVLAGDGPISLTTLFGTHVIVIEGDALGDLSEDDERRQLLFTLATYVGALKARYAQWWSPIFTAFAMTKLTAFVAPFVLPYHRATVYSGDRIAYACCGDLDVSLQAVYRSLVGNGVAPHLRGDGLTGQALEARRRPLLRLAQLLRGTPHATSRYLELLAFVRQQTPAAFEAHRPALAGLDPDADRVLTRLARRRSHPGAVPIGIGLAAAVLVGGLVLGALFRDSVIATSIVTALDPPDGTGQSGSGTGEVPLPSQPQSSDPVPSDPVPSDVELALVQFLPQAVWESCGSGGGDATSGLLASVSCSVGGTQPAVLSLGAYESTAAMTAAFEQLVQGVPEGDCATGNARDTWVLDGLHQGPLACYVSTAGEATVLWGSDANAVLAVASDAGWTPADMFDWWLSDAPRLQ